MTQKSYQAEIIKEISSVKDEQLQIDSKTLLELMGAITGEAPKLWNNKMIGFGTYSYKYKSGREGKWFLTGFCPRKKYLAIYIVDGFEPHKQIMANLGKYKTGASCLYLDTLKDVDMELLKGLIKTSYENMRTKHGLT